MISRGIAYKLKPKIIQYLYSTYYSNYMFTNCKHVKKVLKYLFKSSFYVKAKKYKFHSKSVEYLVYILSSSELTLLDNKMKTIQNCPEPNKVKYIWSFLSFANFYYWFIFNYSNIVISLICLTIIYQVYLFQRYMLETDQCHMQVYLSGNYIPTVISPPNYTNLPSTVATFLTIYLTTVL